MIKQTNMLFMILLSLSAGTADAASQKAYSEYEIKGAYLSNFAKYIDWPGKAFPDKQSPFIIGILGDDPFGNLLDKLVEKKSVKNRSFIVKRFSNIDELVFTHILFISSSFFKRQTMKDNPLKPVIDKLNRCSTLLVGEFNQFETDGGHIRFTFHKKKIRFIMNLKAARYVGLKTRASLLKVAIKVIK